MNNGNDSNVVWGPQPQTAKWLDTFVGKFLADCEFVRTLRQNLLAKTGTRLIDWLDHIGISNPRLEDLQQIGYVSKDNQVYKQPKGIFPWLRISDEPLLAIKVDSVTDFLEIHSLNGQSTIVGEPGAQFRMATIKFQHLRFAVVERHGWAQFDEQEAVLATRDVSKIVDQFRQRSRTAAHPSDDFAACQDLFSQAADEIGADWACDVFFQTEREYWQSRNRAARIQKKRQDQLGLGWANHDHHTYRCSRDHFAQIISVLEQMGFVCRERFYAGEEAGWGAQVLEHPICGIVIFADVDLSPEEVAGDFAHNGLVPDTNLGTVGLWCKLHGDSFLSAGMHHLECQFDFDHAREQLAAEGIETMSPFTDFSFLRQAFTEGERWEVDPDRISCLVSQGSISEDQAQKFRDHGAIGSHLEILERNDGYKGFNQTGVSQIIQKTDPRRI